MELMNMPPTPIDSFYEFQHASLFRWQNLLKSKKHRLLHGKNQYRLIEGACYKVARALSSLYHEEKNKLLFTDEPKEIVNVRIIDIKIIEIELEQYRQKIYILAKLYPSTGEKIIKAIHQFNESLKLKELSKETSIEWCISLSLDPSRNKIYTKREKI